MSLRLLIAVALLAASSCSKDPTPAVDMSMPDEGATAVDAAADLSAPPDLGGGEDLGAIDLGATDTGPDLGPPSTEIPFDEAVFAATHNSYSGGTRGAITEQLEGGVRFIEFDVQADDFATLGYQVGHDMPGHEVEVGAPNPDSVALTDWLAIVTTWHDAHPNHLPLTIGFDIKDPISSVATFEDGNLSRFNSLIATTFGPALLTESDVVDGWPTVEDLRGRILVVLSGDTASRLAYRRTPGTNPAVAGNALQKAIVAHESGGASWVWSGSFFGMARYEITTGTDPTVALSDDGTVVLVTVDSGALQIRTGNLQNDVITWDGPAMPFADPGAAQNPSVRFSDPTTLREIHETPTGELRTWDGTWDATARTITWVAGAAAATRFDETTSGTLTVASVDTPPYGPIVMFNGTRLRLAQWMFSESQFSGPVEFESDDVLFYAADAFGPADVQWAVEKRNAGGIVRLWKFDLPTVMPDPPPTFPATDLPERDFYVDYCRAVRCQVE